MCKRHIRPEQTLLWWPEQKISLLMQTEILLQPFRFQSVLRLHFMILPSQILWMELLQVEIKVGEDLLKKRQAPPLRRGLMHRHSRSAVSARHGALHETIH